MCEAIVESLVISMPVWVFLILEMSLRIQAKRIARAATEEAANIETSKN